MSQLLGNGKHVIYNEKGNFSGFEPYLDTVIKQDLLRPLTKALASISCHSLN
jgi:hypothetical protein